MATEKIQTETRTEFGKGAARRIQREHKIPAVIYGHGSEPIHVILPGHQTMMALKHGGANALVSLDVDGSEQLALTKDVQLDPIRRVIEHLDFVAVRRGEKVTVDVPIHVTGDAAPETLVVTENSVVSVEAEATHIPEFFEVSVEGLPAGTQILAKDLDLPSGTTLLADEDLLIVNVSQQDSTEPSNAEDASPVVLDDALFEALTAVHSRAGVSATPIVAGSDSLAALTDALADAGLTISLLTAVLASLQDEHWLRSSTAPKASLSADARDFLARYGGLELPDDETVMTLEARNSAAILREMAALVEASLSSAQVADLLGIASATVRDRKRDGALYAVSLSRENRFPKWQFEGDRSIPHLEAVLRSLPPGLHPLDVSDYFTVPREWLSVRGQSMSVRDWLVGGGDVATVVSDARFAALLA